MHTRDSTRKSHADVTYFSNKDKCIYFKCKTCNVQAFMGPTAKKMLTNGMNEKIST
jgi:hypothetical protein